MIRVTEEPASLCVGTLCQLFHEHGKAIMGKNFNLNLIAFAEAIQRNIFRVFVARTEDNEAIGYACFTIYNDLMRAHERTADCQAIYVKPSYRGRTAIRLITLAEKCLKESGVNRIFMHVPYEDLKQLGMLLKPKFGYRPLETIVQKEL